MADTHRRVKLYALNAERQWDDRGTGHVSSSYVESLKGMSLQVRAESDGSILLESKIQPDTAYQKQQETLIVWSEGDHYDLALSFQEKAGCDEIWAKICQVQGKDPSVEITQEVAEEDEDRFEDAAPELELPACDVDQLDAIADLLTSCVPYSFKRDKVATAFEKEEYLAKLLQLFKKLEAQQNTKALHKMYEIFKNIFLLNQNSLFEVMLSEESLFDVLGIFEYDPNQASPKRHRDYLKSVSRFKEVIPFGNQKLINKIHQTYRVQYIQDVVLPAPSVFDENMLSTLSSFIFFNKVEIVSLIQEDEKFLRTLFAQITDDSTASSRKRDLVLFLKEFCTFSQTLQPQSRDSFFKALSSLGVLQTLEVILSSDDPMIKAAAVDILTYVVEFSPSMVREFELQPLCQNLTNVIIKQMISDPDPELGMAGQLSSIIRLLLDPDNMLATSVVNKSEKTDFLNFFYKNCMHVLVAPVFENTADAEPTTESCRTAALLSLILELLSFCVEHHSYHIRSYVIQRDLLRKILVLMKSKHTFLVLSSLRFFRKIIGLKDDFYNRHIISSNLFAPIVEALQANNGRYNLLDSAIIELFEFIRTDEIRTLCIHIIDKFGKQLEKVDYVRTFKGLKLQFDQYSDRLKDRDSMNNSPLIMHTKFRRDQRDMEEEEECWFDRDDEEVDDIDPTLDDCYKFELTEDLPSKKSNDRKIGAIAYSPIETVKSANVNRNSTNARKTQITSSNSNSTSSNSEAPPSRKQGPLVDYPDEDSDEEEEEDEDGMTTASAPKRPRLIS